MSDDPRSRLRKALAEALRRCDERNLNYASVGWDDLHDQAQAMYLYDADAILAVLPEHRDDVLALAGGCPHVVQGVEGTAFCDLADSSGACAPSREREAAGGAATGGRGRLPR